MRFLQKSRFQRTILLIANSFGGRVQTDLRRSVMQVDVIEEQNQIKSNGGAEICVQERSLFIAILPFTNEKAALNSIENSAFQKAQA